MTFRAAVLGLALLCAVPLEAQQPASPRRYVVRGVVFDSIAHAPLVGALVQVTSRDSMNDLFTATTDSAGTFHIGNLPAGQFLIGFYHEALTALGLDAPLRSFELAADSVVTVDIAVPSGSVVRSLRCGADSAKAGDGMLAGFVRDADGGAALTGATVAVEWRAISLEPGNYRTVPQRVTAPVNGDGTYRLCALPPDVPLTLRASAPGHRTVAGPVIVPASAVSRRDVRLADSAVARGSAVLRGRAVQANGRPVMTGRATIAALTRDAPVGNGAFAIAGLPSGTWLVEVRAVGLDPQTALFDAGDGAAATDTITLTERTQKLDAVTVMGAPSRDVRVLEDVLLHQRQGFATVFLPGNPWLQDAQHIAEVLRAAHGFSYRNPTQVYARAVPGGLSGGAGTGCTRIAVYLNGERLIGGLEDLDHFVRVREVLAVEAFPDMTAIPPQWRTSDRTCAVVAVWTSRR